MLASPATTVEGYLASLPPDRRAHIATVRDVILEALPAGFEESMQFGMLGYCVPLSRYPKTYNGKPLMVAALAAQKGYMSLYLMTVYGNAEAEREFAKAFGEAGKKLDMGKSCVRFKSADDLPLGVVRAVIRATSVDDFIALYEASRNQSKRVAPSSAKPAAKGKPAPAAAGRAPSEQKPAARKKRASGKKKPAAAGKKAASRKKAAGAAKKGGAPKARPAAAKKRPRVAKKKKKAGFR